MHEHKYMEKLDFEIHALIEEEAKDNNMGVDYQRQKELHLLFENRKHLKEWMSDKHSMRDHRDVMQAEKTGYFGEVKYGI